MPPVEEFFPATQSNVAENLGIIELFPISQTSREGHIFNLYLSEARIYQKSIWYAEWSFVFVKDTDSKVICCVFFAETGITITS